MQLNKEIYKTLTILCVEDEEYILKIYKELFGLFFQEVYFASNGEEGLKEFKKHHIDMILTDQMMPKMSGLDMAAEIRKLDATIPIILVTAIDGNETLQKALDVNITSFLKKPFTQESIFRIFDTSVKSVIADRILLRQQQLSIDYSQYQESISFDKEKLIIKDESRHTKHSLSTYYKPLDILSGDSYIVKKVSDKEDFVFIADGMGKGISASITAMLSSSFMNYYISKHKTNTTSILNLKQLIDQFFIYIQPNLLEEEALSTTILLFNHEKKELSYAIFSMPALLYKNKHSHEVATIKSNNPPLSPYSQSFKIDTIDILNLEKLLVYSDGLNENMINNNTTYEQYLLEDFLRAKTEMEFRSFMQQKIKKQEDDITYIFLSTED